MDVVVSRSAVRGTARVPPSKSYTHRAILAAGYGDTEVVVRDPLWSADTRATARAVEAFGGTVVDEGEAATGPGLSGIGIEEEDDEGEGDTSALAVTGFGGRPRVPENVIDCRNSGTTMRLVCATGALCPGLVVLTGDGSLRSRPQEPLLRAIRDLGGRAESTRGNGQAPLVLGGRVLEAENPSREAANAERAPIRGGEVSIPGDVSSQFVSALCMAGGVCEAGIEIALETELKSAPYVEITREVLADFGVETERDGRTFAVPGGQDYRPPNGEYTVPGDFSSASYLLAAGALAADDDGVRIEGVYPSAQGDSAVVEVLRRMGAAVSWNETAGTIAIERSALSGIEVDVGDTPDLLPTIATLGAAATGQTRITNCEHVRYKETDRVAAMASELSELGASVNEERDTLTIDGGNSTLRGSQVSGYADHRIVMALAVCGLVAEGKTTVSDAEHVDVSFPGFFDVLCELGGDLDAAR